MAPQRPRAVEVRGDPGLPRAASLVSRLGEGTAWQKPVQPLEVDLRVELDQKKL